MAENKFNAGDLAQIIATGEVVTIIAVSPGMRGTFYTVFQDGKRNRYRESELAPYFDRESGIIDSLRSGKLANAESFQRYAYYRLFSENQEGNLFSYQGNKIIFNPFQYKPLMKFLAADSDERLLVADEVGVGKTIESGIILDELFARQELQGSDVVMIVCPSILCQKWQAELRSKFLMDDFFVHDGKSLSYALEELAGSGRVAYPHSIVSEQLVRGAKYRRLLRECLENIGGPFIQMLIVDECHHYRNLGTNTNSVGNLLSLCSERLLMLSATPFNLRSDDLYNQLHMLNPSLFQDQQVFNQLQRQIRSINQAIACVKRDDPESRRALVELLADLSPIAMSNGLIADDFGEIIDLIPVARGKSGRIWKLKIVGTKKTLTIGKELEIRRALSETHLYSSAFDVVKEGDKFVLNGKGWGHGVGLCQIGAAVMGEQGKTYDEILLFYYRNAKIEKLYE